MAVLQCRVCGKGDALAFCSETGEPMCGACSATCQVCNVPLSKTRVQLTSTGRKLCSKCMSERNERRKAKKDEMKRAARAEARGEAPPAKRPAAPVAASGTSLQALAATGPKSAGTSFQDLMAGDDSPMMPRVRDEEPGAATDEPAREVHGLFKGEAGDDRIWGAEGPPKEGGGRLQLPPVDDKRPILMASGYQPPKRTSWIAAFALFGIAGAIFWSISPGFRDLMFPEDLARPKFISDLRPVATDTNALRNTSNISQFEILKQGPIFITAWLIVGVYCLGFCLIVFSVIRSLISSFFAKRRFKRAQEYAEKYGVTYPD